MVSKLCTNNYFSFVVSLSLLGFENLPAATRGPEGNRNENE